MTSCTLPLISCRRLAALAVALPLVAGAHPGHEGDHGLTWDLTAAGTLDPVHLLVPLLTEALSHAPACIAAARAIPLAEIGWFNPWLDIAAARHEAANATAAVMSTRPG